MAEEALAWLTSMALGIGVSTTVIVLVLAALQGRRTLEYGSAVASWYRIALVTVGLLGIGLAAGVITSLLAGEDHEGWLVGIIDRRWISS